ncbi:TolC family protein [Azotobacter beijerinckii]|uniref:Efflux transporter, outer membrane factor (OMF) lipoprotein, NodT family n=1 Tax=Azotobacter beijerinckii TaxID=170623 RepID=A0A1I4CHL0_9GAMM|nr:TolC family protein [Azotobacter beijerinckii]SFB37786.1 efflux transporter, outer membrane factor (OMF) lipoprotein, NodT family [Azotobacter beijerinckii]SFK80714.1 efflux transporter, outer membrane factor (OMF) lipoprotein, NodT family [Azotobacter beijerinckii]
MPDRSGTRPWLAPLLLLATCALGGCTRLGPDFQSPREAWIEHWDSDMLAQAGTMHVQPDNRQWWTQLGDPLLDRLIAHADAHNPDLRIAGLRILEARARLGIALSGLSPQLRQATAEALYLDRQQSGGRIPQDRHAWQYDAGLSVGWELDFWGRYSRAIESADAAYFAAQANHQDVLVLLRAQVAQTYFALRTAEARLRIARENAERQKRSFEITERLFLSGNSDELDLQQAKTQYLGTLSTLPEFETQVRQTRNALSVLIGTPPNTLPELAVHTGLVPLLDRALLDDVPANLLLRRPDVRAAELQVAAQSAQVGLAETDLYPSLSLLGGIGWSASSLDGSSDTRDLIGGPSIVWNVFDNGRLRNNVRAQDARLQQLIEAYRDQVRQAAREADDAATGLVKALERERILREASISAQRALTLASAQYREGYIDFQRVLDAQRALLAQQDSYLVTRNAAINSLIDLYKALGGGWYSERPPIDAASREQMAKRTDWGDLLDEVSPSSDKADNHD